MGRPVMCVLTHREMKQRGGCTARNESMCGGPSGYDESRTLTSNKSLWRRAQVRNDALERFATDVICSRAHRSSAETI